MHKGASDTLIYPSSFDKGRIFGAHIKILSERLKYRIPFAGYQSKEWACHWDRLRSSLIIGSMHCDVSCNSTDVEGREERLKREEDGGVSDKSIRGTSRKVGAMEIWGWRKQRLLEDKEQDIPAKQSMKVCIYQKEHTKHQTRLYHLPCVQITFIYMPRHICPLWIALLPTLNSQLPNSDSQFLSLDLTSPPSRWRSLSSVAPDNWDNVRFWSGLAYIRSGTVCKH